MRKLNLFATCIYSSSLVIQNKRCGLVHLFDFYFPIKKNNNIKKKKKKGTQTNKLSLFSHYLSTPTFLSSLDFKNLYNVKLLTVEQFP